MDIFGGSGTTAVAATNKGFNVVLCEREDEYVADIRARFGVPRVESPPLAPDTHTHTHTTGTADLRAIRGREIRKGRTIGPIGLKS